MRHSLFWFCAAMALPPLAGNAASPEDVLEEVIVTATLRPQALQAVPGSVTALDSQVLQDAGQQHFEDVLGLVPNLNWAAGTSRPRYFQIRGIGEREQYEGAPNPSVGFLIDDIDFSGLGMPATLFDVQQIEVLRGPQGTRYGANALAGLISVRGKDPEQTAHYSAEATVGDYGTRSLGVSATGPVESLDSAWRLSLQQYRSDGFMNNPFLHRDDTNGRNELTGRFKWRWQASDAATLDFTLLHANLDNNYDAFTLDNSRNTLSDKPGKDAERTTGAALKWNEQLADALTFTATGTMADTHSLHAYDGDWGNAQSWRPFTYDYVYRADRNRSTRSLELRLASASSDGLNWLVGAYGLNLREHIREVSRGEYGDPVVYDYFSSTNDFLDSRYDATNLAVFGQLDGRIAQRWSWSAGLRGEQRDADYHDGGSTLEGPRTPVLGNERDRMWGGQTSLSFDLDRTSKLYATISRGYKAGGFNLGSSAAAKPRFKPETLWSYELGAKGTALQGRMYLDTAFFYELRRDMQVLNGEQLVAGDPNSFVFFTDNAAHGYNAGVESSLRVKLTAALELGGSLGLLRTRASGYLDEDGNFVPSREQAHAPEYTASLYAVWRDASGFMARVDVSAKDNFYFDVPPNPTQSNAYSLTHLKLGYEAPAWDVYLWVRNVFDKDYATRGFYFGNEPPDFPSQSYIQYGDPRQIGITANWNF